MNFPEKDIFTLQELVDKWSKDFPTKVKVDDILSYGAKKLLPIYIPISRDRVTICKLISDVQHELVHNYSNTADTVNPEVEKYIDKLTIYRKDCESDVLGLMSLPDLQYLSQSKGESIYLKYLLTEKFNEILYVLNDYSMYGGGGNVYLKYEYLYVKLEDKQKFEEKYLVEKPEEKVGSNVNGGDLREQLRKNGKKGGRSKKHDTNFQLFVDQLVQNGKKQGELVKELKEECIYKSMPKGDDPTWETGLGEICDDLYLLDDKIYYTSYKKRKSIALGTLRNYFKRAKEKLN